MWDEITHPFTNLNGGTVEVWEWKNNFIPNFTGNVITNLCWDWSLSMFIKGPQVTIINILTNANVLLLETDMKLESKYNFHSGKRIWKYQANMMTLLNTYGVRVTDHLKGETTGHQRFPLIKAYQHSFEILFTLALANSWINRRCWHIVIHYIHGNKFQWNCNQIAGVDKDLCHHIVSLGHT